MLRKYAGIFHNIAVELEEQVVRAAMLVPGYIPTPYQLPNPLYWGYWLVCTVNCLSNINSVHFLTKIIII